MDIAVIGAGPIGCYTGYLLAKSGHKVAIYERKSKIGLPIQCTGVLTSEFDKLGIPRDSFVINTIERIAVASPRGTVSFRQKDYIICREKMDNYLADLARKERVKIFLGHNFLRQEEGSIVLFDTVRKAEKRINPDIIIGADGPFSCTAKAFGFYHPERKNYLGVQAVVEGKFAPQVIQTFFGKDICPGLFAWIVPESSSRARAGLAALNNSQDHFKEFLRKNNLTVKEMQGGIIPLYHPKQKLHIKNCYLVGDASGYVKATTLGGLVPGLQQAEILAECINTVKDYETEIEPVRKQMNLHLKMHNIFRKFSDSDWDNLIKLADQPRLKEILERYTRDNPLPLITKALWHEPRLLFFAKYLF